MIHNKIKMNTKVKILFSGIGLTIGLVLMIFLLCKFGSEAKAASAEFKISSSDTRDQRNPAVAVDNQNRFYVVWEDNRERPDRFDIYGRIFDSKGHAVTTDANALDANNVDSCYHPSLAINNIGNVYLAWQDKNRAPGQYGGDNIFARLFRYLPGNTLDLGTAQQGPGGNDSDFRVNDDLGIYTCDDPIVATDGINFVTSYFNWRDPHQGPQ